MSSLEILATNVKDARGIAHQMYLKGLRTYIKNTPDDILLRQIATIDNTDILRTLIEAGLRNPLLDTVTQRYDTIQKRKAGVI